MDEHFDHAGLKALLQEARPEPGLPTGFSQAVMRRVRVGDRVSSIADRLDQLCAWLLRPRLALAYALVVLAIGGSIGAATGVNAANNLARERYLQSVSPMDVRP